MIAKSKPLLALTAADLMTRNLVQLPQEMSLRDAASLLLQNQIGGAPVVDNQGRCIGVFSAIDFLRSEMGADAASPVSSGLPITCVFQARHPTRTSDGKEVTPCMLPSGLGECPIQIKQEGPDGTKVNICSQPNSIFVAWQMVDIERLPVDAVSRFMTPDPVTAQPDTSIRVLARMMMDIHIHRIIVVDKARWPIGVVSSTDVLEALAYSDG